MDGFPILLAIFFSEFHPIHGPQVCFEVPEGFLTSTKTSCSTVAPPTSASSIPTQSTSHVPSTSHHNYLTGASLSFYEAPKKSFIETQSPSSHASGIHEISVSEHPYTINHSEFASSHKTDASFDSGRSQSPLLPILGESKGNNSQFYGSSFQRSFIDHVASPLNHSTWNQYGSAIDNAPEATLDFDSISEYLIPKSELCNQLVSVSTQFYRVIGYPVLIEDSRYVRNSFLFNLCFVFDKMSDTACYEQIVCKVARELRALEVESEFLNNPTSKNMLGSILEQLFDDLNSYHECQITINEANTINLKLFPNYQPPNIVYEFDVPVAMLDLSKIMDKHWDLVLQRIILYINGVHSVKTIALLADADLSLVRLAIRHLVYYGCVKIVDIFQFTNVYSITPTINKLLSSPVLQDECAQFVLKEGYAPTYSAMIFQMYCAFGGGLAVSDLIRENDFSSYVDARRFVVFGVIKGFLRRLHHYPILSITRTRAHSTTDDKLLLQHYASPNSSLTNLLDGNHHFDSICTRFNMSVDELRNVLAKLDVYVILK